MSDPRQEALQTVTELLAKAERRPLDAAACRLLADHVHLVPGYLKRAAHALSKQREPFAVDALLGLPPTVPGVVEGLYQAFVHGVSRQRADGTSGAPMLAIDFRKSRAQGFDDLVARARALFSDSYESLRVEGRIYHRFGIQTARGTVAGRAAAIAHDLQWLHARLAKLSGTRLWLNGWPFSSAGLIKGPVQAHLVRAWLTWAATQTQTRASR